jgi:magnesium-transporting ATPase (P-type)
VRLLLQPKVLNLAVIAALASALACYPRISLWTGRSAPIWYLEGAIFLCGIVLWSFVFAWHEPYTHRPVFVLKPEPKLFLAATLIGIVAAVVFHLWLDPSLRSKLPDEYPASLQQWFAQVLFALAFNQLFLLFAPFAWLMRLFKNRQAAISLTVLFGVCILAMKIRSLPTPVPPLPLAALLAGRIVMGFLAVSFYLRGGVLLVWWWTLLFEARLLP